MAPWSIEGRALGAIIRARPIRLTGEGCAARRRGNGEGGMVEACSALLEEFKQHFLQNEGANPNVEACSALLPKLKVRQAIVRYVLFGSALVGW